MKRNYKNKNYCTQLFTEYCCAVKIKISRMFKTFIEKITKVDQNMWLCSHSAIPQEVENINDRKARWSLSYAFEMVSYYLAYAL